MGQYCPLDSRSTRPGPTEIICVRKTYADFIETMHRVPEINSCTEVSLVLPSYGICDAIAGMDSPAHGLELVFVDSLRAN